MELVKIMKNPKMIFVAILALIGSITIISWFLLFNDVNSSKSKTGIVRKLK